MCLEWYPYFIQFICREVFDVAMQGEEAAHLPIDEILKKLDTDFFAGRWARATDRQRELLTVIASLDTTADEFASDEFASDKFTVQQIAEKSREMLAKPFSPSQVSQMLAVLGNAGLIYKNRHGKYSFAVPLLGEFILRQRR